MELVNDNMAVHVSAFHWGLDNKGTSLMATCTIDTIDTAEIYYTHKLPFAPTLVLPGC